MGKRVGGGDSSVVVTRDPGTFIAAASTSGTARFPLSPGFLTELSIRVNGDLTVAAITGGPVKIDAWLERSGAYRKLCSGTIRNEFTVKGSGQLPVPNGGNIFIRYVELSASSVSVRVDAIEDLEAMGDSAPGWKDETQELNFSVSPIIQRTTADPAAGANPNGMAALVGFTRFFHGIRVTVVADANPANRTLTIAVNPDGANAMFLNTTTNAQIAGETHIYFVHFAHPYAEVYDVANKYHYIGFGLSGPVRLEGAGTVSLTLNNKQATDNPGASFVWTQEAPG